MEASAGMKLKFETVMWSDHAGGDGWRVTNEVMCLEPVKLISAGWIIRETDEFLTLLPHLGLDGGNHRGDICLVKSAITHRKRFPKLDR
jgi:hypothetical protein